MQMSPLLPALLWLPLWMNCKLHSPANKQALQSLKAYILSVGSTDAQKDEGYKLAEQLAAKEPVITDLESLALIQQAFLNAHRKRLAPAPAASRSSDAAAAIWERALKAKSGDEAFARECYMACLERHDWAGAQKVAPERRCLEALRIGSGPCLLSPVLSSCINAECPTGWMHLSFISSKLIHFIEKIYFFCI